MNPFFLLLSLESQFSLQLLFMLSLLLLQLSLHVRVALHELLAETVDLEIGILHDETSICDFILAGHLHRHILIDLLFDLLLSLLSNIGTFQFIPNLIVQSLMHQIAVHVLLQQLSVDEILATKFIHLLLADELILVINHLCVLLF
jgi:hypothetical protein